MRIRVVGAGFYGAHIALSLIKDGHDVEIHEIRDGMFKGASGGIPARIHQGFHYPRSKKTRDACQKHIPEFMRVYGAFAKQVPVNVYAIAQDQSMVDYEQYIDTLKREVDFLEVDPVTYGLVNVEGAVLTNEQHIVTDRVKNHFGCVLSDHIKYNTPAGVIDDPSYDLTIDCSFCANDNAGIDRYEPCVVGMLSGPTDTAVTIMDGPFGSLYPWNEEQGLNSLSSAKWSPLSKTCKNWSEANHILETTPEKHVIKRVQNMFNDLIEYYPRLADDYRIEGYHTSIRAMPLSGADARLVDVVKVGEKAIRVRAGKIDAVIHAERIIKEEYIK